MRAQFNNFGTFLFDFFPNLIEQAKIVNREVLLPPATTPRDN
ncbi:MAG: hypothetical protein QNJ55_09460 [Xenococcus sp. MO_188.B8]|nr:hypothetical protein [Xenococcus sp. MO_188.B8]